MKNRGVADEFVDVDLGDARRAARVLQVVRGLEKDPSASFPQAMKTVAAREAFYRLLNNQSVTLEALLQPHFAQTVGRVLSHETRPVIAIDKTRFCFVGEGERDGLERASNNKQIFEAFFALAMSSERRTHGVLGVEPLKGTGSSSAAHWNDFLGHVSCELEDAGAKPIFVMDREADTYELFSELIGAKRDFVVRICYDRVAKEFADGLREPIREIAARAPTVLSRTVWLSTRKRGGRAGTALKTYPPRVSRQATLSVRGCALWLPNPNTQKLKRLPKALRVNLVQVIELDPPANEDPVEWLLVTTLPIEGASSIATVVDSYRARWTIEEYFRALKTGCQYEARQLESLHALTNALALLVPIAWRLLELRTVGEEEPEALASEILDPDEIDVLRELSTDVKLGRRPLASQALLAIAALGGHIRQNGRPGWQILFRGWKDLAMHVQGYRLAKKAKKAKK